MIKLSTDPANPNVIIQTEESGHVTYAHFGNLRPQEMIAEFFIGLNHYPDGTEVELPSGEVVTLPYEPEITVEEPAAITEEPSA